MYGRYIKRFSCKKEMLKILDRVSNIQIVSEEIKTALFKQHEKSYMIQYTCIRSLFRHHLHARVK